MPSYDLSSATAMLSRPPGLEPYSAEWWLYELEEELDRRQDLVRLYEDYYEGRHRLCFATSKYRELFGQMLAAVADNWIPLIVNAQVERLRVQAFLFGEAKKGDDDAWAIWQQNGLDADAPIAFTEAAKHGESYLLVWPDQESAPSGFFGRLFSRRSEERPARITVEHPSQVIVRRQAGDRRRRAAALKRWQEDDGSLRATLYLPQSTYRFQRKNESGQQWEPREGAHAASPNPLGVVPVVPLVNDPHMLPCRPPRALTVAPHSVSEWASVGLGRSEEADAISSVDQINKLICDMLIASEVASFRQRWATGIEIPIDEDTGKPKEPFQSGIDRLWSTAGENAKFGDFEATQLENYTKAIESRVTSLAARTRTPPHYLLGNIVNASGDALKAAETGLSSKCKGRQPHLGEGLEEALRLAFAWKGDERAGDVNAETAWEQTESRSESEYMDSLVKKMAIGVPKEQLWKDAGYSPQQIGEFKTMLLEQARMMGVFDAGSAPEPPPELNAGD